MEGSRLPLCLCAWERWAEWKDYTPIPSEESALFTPNREAERVKTGVLIILYSFFIPLSILPQLSLSRPQLRGWWLWKSEEPRWDVLWSSRAKFVTRSKVTLRPSERRAAIIKQPSISDCIQLIFYCFYLLVLLFFFFLLHLPRCYTTPHTLSLCHMSFHILQVLFLWWPDLCLLGLRGSDVYSVQHYLQHCNLHIKPVIVCVYLCLCAYGSVAGWKSSVWKHRATSLPFIHVNTTLSILILSALQRSVVAARARPGLKRGSWSCWRPVCMTPVPVMLWSRSNGGLFGVG